MGNWHRRAKGHYVRKRGSVYDTVRRANNGWVAFVDGKGGKRVFKTRIEATSAINMYIAAGPNPEPVEQPKAETETERCDGCNGSGIYYGHGYMLNGVFQGKTGKCFRCGGKGFQTEEDVRRNRYYDNNVRRVEA